MSTIHLFSDYHMHPQGHRLQRYSQELLQPWADHCREKGITDFAITDHDRYHPGVVFEEIEKFQEKNPDLKIRAGIELDNDPTYSKAGRNWVEKNWDKLDFVLGSVHFLGDWAFDHAGQEAEFEKRDTEQVYLNYTAEMTALIKRGHIDCLSHLDLIKIFKFVPDDGLEKYFIPILEQIKAADLSMEINTAGWRKPIGIQYPDQSLIQHALALGIPFTISSDAHSHVQTGEDYARLTTLMEEMNMTEVAIYEHHKRKMVSVASA